MSLGFRCSDYVSSCSPCMVKARHDSCKGSLPDKEKKTPGNLYSSHLGHRRRMLRIHFKQLSVLRHSLKSRICQSHHHSLPHRTDGADSTISSAGSRERRRRIHATHVQSRAFASTDPLPRRLKALIFPISMVVFVSASVQL